MGFGERAAERRKEKELKGELRQMKKELLAAGCERGMAGTAVKEFGEALVLGGSLRSGYEEAREHLLWARQAIGVLLGNMGEELDGEMEMSFSALIEGLGQVYHECLIREDDMDFRSSVRCLQRFAEESERAAKGGFAVSKGKERRAGNPSGSREGHTESGSREGHTEDVRAAKGGPAGMSVLMLRSELENLKAVLDDASGWAAPDFFALAYYILHEGREELGEMENARRNERVLSYTNERFTDAFRRECRRAGVERKARQLVWKWTYGRDGREAEEVS